MTDANSHAPDDPDPTDAPALLADLLRRLTRLVSNEIALAKREMAQKLSRAMGGALMLAFSAFLMISGVNTLTAAAVAALGQAGLSISVASLVVAAVVFAMAAGLYVIGKSRITAQSLTPDRTIKSVKRDIQTIKENANV